MRHHLVPALILALTVIWSAACKSDHERTAESLAAFVEAKVIHRAPYHAYALLDSEDKAHVSVEAWATKFDEREPAFPTGTAITVGDLSIKGDRAEAVVKITPPNREPETRKYVLRREGTKWRIWMGLAKLDELRSQLANAQRIADDGAVEQARDKVEAVAAAGFDASLPESLESEILAVRQRLGNKERFVELDTRFTNAMQADLEKMKAELAALAEEVGPDDEAFFPRLEALKKEAVRVERQVAIDGFEFKDIRARQFRDAWGMFREVRFKATNNTGRPLSKLAVRLDLTNEGSDTPLGSVVWQLIEDGGTLAPDKAVEVKREVDKAPDDWKGQQVVVRVDDLQFADGEADDAG